MSCVYSYKGHLIGDIKKLDDFLISKQKYYSTYGDLVFSINPEIQKKLDKIQEKSKELQQKMKEAKRQYVNDEEVLRLKRPYVGVLECLSGVKNPVTDKQFIMDFRPTPYWQKRFHAWTKGQKSQSEDHNDGFTQDEIDLFFNGDESKIKPIEIGNPNDWPTEENSEEEFGTDEQKRLRKLMEDKWKAQAELGTEVHDVLQQLFSKTQYGDTYWVDIIDRYEESFFKKFPNLAQDKLKSIIFYAKNLKQEIEKQFGSGCEFYPEIAISSKLTSQYEGRTDLSILGRIDLLVIDANGVPHVIDYKASPKPYENYNRAKTQTFSYQLSLYKRMLAYYDFNIMDSKILVAPIQMTNFSFRGDHWDFDNIEIGSIQTKSLIDVEQTANISNIQNNLDLILEEPLLTSIDTEDTIENVSTTMESWFSGVTTRKQKTRDEIIELIKEQDGFTSKTYKPKTGGDPIVANSEAELIQKVTEFHNKRFLNNVTRTRNIRDSLKKAQEPNGEYELPSYYDSWLRDRLSKYAHEQWEVLTGDGMDAAMQFGIILVQNKLTKLIDVITIAPESNLSYQNTWGKNKNLTGNLEPDIKEDSRSDSLMLRALNGNVRLMETMLVLNHLKYNTPIQIGNISVIHPDSESSGISASNKELLYCWNRLNNLKPTKGINKFQNGSIKLISRTEQCYQQFQEIMERADPYTKRKFNVFIPHLTDLQQGLGPNNREECLAALQKLANELVKLYGSKLNDLDASGNSTFISLDMYDQDYARTLYQSVMAAMLEMSNVDARQMHQDNKKLLQNKNIITKGIQGTMIDNAGNFLNQLLNEVSNSALEGYQNARDAASRRLNQLRLKTEKLKRDMGFSGILEHTIGNQTALYNGMIEFTGDNNIRFVNPWKNPKNLTQSQIEYLKFIITEINKDRFSSWSESKIEQAIERDEIQYFEVPLMEASLASKVNSVGWLGWLKNKLRRMSSVKEIKRTLEDAATQYLDTDTEDSFQEEKNIFEVVNMMEQGNGERRQRIIQDKLRLGEDYMKAFFEQDLERILSTHIWAYETTNALSNRMVLIKAAHIAIAAQGNEQNVVFKDTLDFMTKYVKNKINHQSIDQSNMKQLKGFVKELQSMTSWLALAFSPVQFTYQTLEGIWKVGKLVWSKFDGKETFTLKNMEKAMKTVYKEIFHYSDIPSVPSAVNAFYGINDMDNAAFADNNTSNRHGIFNFFSKFAYKFSSRPDFYNRMTIFVAQMMHDGSYEAHYIDSNGNLKYNYQKDARFAAYANDPSGKNKTAAWNKAYALYLATANQLVKEGARNENGTFFTIGQPLPKAYSNKESEAMKAVGDSMYGYYDSTKKSLWQATLIGGLFMQMRTYWSSKKNQYFGPQGFKNQGRWVHAEEIVTDQETGKPKLDENGNPIKEKMYYAKLPNGEINYNAFPVSESNPNRSDVPFMQWKGKYEEGIILTLAQLVMEVYHTGSTKGVFESMAQGDEDLVKTYKSNMKILIYDLLMAFIIGGLFASLLSDWVDEEEKDYKKHSNMSTALMLTFANLCYRTVKNSSLDFLWPKAIFEFSYDWNPFSLNFATSEVKNIANLITGDASFVQTITKSMSAARQFRPIFQLLEEE